MKPTLKTLGGMKDGQSDLKILRLAPSREKFKDFRRKPEMPTALQAFNLKTGTSAPAQTYSTATRALSLDQIKGFDAILQLTNGVYEDLYNRALQVAGKNILQSFVFTGWLFFLYRVTISFDSSNGVIFDVDRSRVDNLRITGRFSAKVSTRNGDNTWTSPVSITGTYSIGGPLMTFPEIKFRLDEENPNLEIPVKGVIAANLVGQTPVITPSTPTSSTFYDLAITSAIQHYFSTHLRWLPVMGELPVLKVEMPPNIPLRIAASGVTIPNGGTAPIVSMQFGDPSRVYRQPLVPSGSNCTLGIASHIVTGLIERAIPAQLRVDASTVVTNRYVDFEEGFIRVRIVGVRETCECFPDIEFEVTQRFAPRFDRDHNMSIVPLDDEIINASDRAIIRAVLSVTILGELLFSILEELFLKPMEASANRTLMNTLRSATLIPPVIVFPLVPLVVLRGVLTGVRINSLGIFFDANISVHDQDPVAIRVFRGDNFTGAQRVIEPNPMSETTEFSVSLSAPGGAGTVWNAFGSLEIHPYPGRSFRKVRIVFVNDRTGRKKRFQDRRLSGGVVRISSIRAMAIQPNRVYIRYIP